MAAGITALTSALQSCTALTGGGEGKLDGLVTAGSTGLAVGTRALVVTSSGWYLYQLLSGTTAESSPTIIRPDDYDGSTNQKVWSLLHAELAGSKSVDLTSIAAGGNADDTITVTGAAVGDYVVLSHGTGSPEPELQWEAFVSAADTVKVRAHNVSTGSVDPASQTISVLVIKKA